MVTLQTQISPKTTVYLIYYGRSVQCFVPQRIYCYSDAKKIGSINKTKTVNKGLITWHIHRLPNTAKRQFKPYWITMKKIVEHGIWEWAILRPRGQGKKGQLIWWVRVKYKALMISQFSKFYCNVLLHIPRRLRPVK